eukprot:2672505-Rhodomonas_salina.1
MPTSCPTERERSTRKTTLNNISDTDPDVLCIVCPKLVSAAPDCLHGLQRGARAVTLGCAATRKPLPCLEPTVFPHNHGEVFCVCVQALECCGLRKKQQLNTRIIIKDHQGCSQISRFFSFY